MCLLVCFHGRRCHSKFRFPLKGKRNLAPTGANSFHLKLTNKLKREANVKLADLLFVSACIRLFSSSSQFPRRLIARNPYDAPPGTEPRGYYIVFMLNLAEHDFFLLIYVKMPTTVVILTFMSRKNSILGLSEPKNKLNYWTCLHL